jgi:hypothetical protein
MGQIMRVLGAEPSKGEFEGRAYDNTKIHCEVPFSKKKTEALGVASETYNFGDSVQGMAKIKALGVALPCNLDVEIIAIQNGMEIVSISKLVDKK